MGIGGGLMEGNLQLFLCPRGGDEEKKNVNPTVEDFKSLKKMILEYLKKAGTHFLLNSE